MLLGLISDTHGLLRPEVFSAFAGVDRIVHAGDIGEPDLLGELEAIAPVTAVWGNTDGWVLRDRLPESVTIELDEIEIAIVHGHQHGSPSAALLAVDHPGADLIVFGHTHCPVIERVGEILTINPGSAGPARFGLPVTVALATLDGTRVSARHLHLVER